MGKLMLSVSTTLDGFITDKGGGMYWIIRPPAKVIQGSSHGCKGQR